MSSGRFRLVPAQAYCSRCRELFVYFRANNEQKLCRPCLPKEAAEANAFYNPIHNARRAALACNAEAADANPA